VHGFFRAKNQYAALAQLPDAVNGNAVLIVRR
jgi:hypothetical protein